MTTAVFIGGPKHGDIDVLPDRHREILIPVSDARYKTSFNDYGHYAATTESSFRQGRYSIEHELWGVPDMPGSHRQFLYLWRGIR